MGGGGTLISASGYVIEEGALILSWLEREIGMSLHGVFYFIDKSLNS